MRAGLFLFLKVGTKITTVDVIDKLELTRLPMESPMWLTGSILGGKRHPEYFRGGAIT